MPHVTAIIPARLNSSRFPRKVLYPLALGRSGKKPLIYYVWKAACQANTVNRIFIATDSEDIGRAVNDFGGAVIMTSSRPRNGTERVAEAMHGLKTDIVINIQADNLSLNGKILDRVVNAMAADNNIEFATLACPIRREHQNDKLQNKNVVKVVGDGKNGGRALWFSRLPIPLVKKKSAGEYHYLEHIGVYFMKLSALFDYAGWPIGRAEKAESLEQLRILENGRDINLFLTRSRIISVDSKKALNLLVKGKR